MAKGSSIWIDQLVSLLGLDKESVKTQVLPFLDSFDDETLLRTHLQGLVGTDTPLAKSFVRDFTRSRFPQQAPSPSGSSMPTLQATSASAAQVSAQKKRGKKTLAQRAGIGQTLAPRKVEDVELDGDEQMAKLAEAFGGMGTVYSKKQDEDDFFAGIAKGRKGKQPGSKHGAMTGSSTPLEQSESATPAMPESTPMQPSTTIDEPSTSASASQAKSQPSPPPTAEMLAIDAVIEELTSTASSGSVSTDVNRNMCFCQGRRHALAPHAPLCYACGLILCSAIHPSPLSPLSSCPSCSASPLLGAAARSDLVAKLSSQREFLFEQQLLQIQIQRQQKRLNKSAARSAREEEAALFPKLGMEAAFAPHASGVSHAAPVIGKHGALQKARAIAGDAQRTAKVLSLDMKTHKVKTHTKVKREVAVKQEPEEVEVEEDVEENRDPFVGLDGLALVRNEADDGLRGEVKGRTSGKSKMAGGKAIPQRAWTFGDRQITLRPTPPVQ